MNVRGFATAANTGSVFRLVGGLCVWLAIIAGSAVAQTGGWHDSRGRTKGHGTDARQIRPGIRAFIPGADRAADAEVSEMSTPSYWVSSSGIIGNNDSWTGAVRPDAGETAIFTGGRSQQNATSLNTQAAGYPDAIIIRDDFYGSIGGPSNYLINLQGAKLIIRGHGSYYMACATATEVVVNSPDAYVSLISNAYTITTLAGETVLPGIHAGTSYGFDVTGTVHVAGTQARVTIAASASTAYPAAVIVEDGTLLFQQELQSNATNRLIAIQTGGTWRQEGVIGTDYIYIHGGVFTYAPNASPSAKAPSFYINGVLDLRECDYPVPVTRLVIGPQGEVWGSALETGNALIDLDLRQNYP